MTADGNYARLQAASRVVIETEHHDPIAIVTRT